MIEGAKWCGKTSTAEQAAKSALYIANPEVEQQAELMASISPSRLLEGDTPRLIDEWQLIPTIWDAIRYEVDHRDETGQFILTGSVVPISTDSIHHTGTGRFSWILMRPMSLYESNESTGSVSLASLFESSHQIEGTNPLDINHLAFALCRGGWPRSVDLLPEIALEQAFDYFESIIHSEASRVDGTTRNPERVRRLMRSYGRHIGTQATISTIKSDLIVNEAQNFSEDTVASYRNALQKIFVIEEMEAWNPNLRSKTAIRTSNTHYYVDPSIAIAALGLGPQDLIDDLNTFGFMFENMCIRDLRIYADVINGKVYHYRDKSGLECDAVVHLRNGYYGLIEIKLGGNKLIQEGIDNLNKLSSKIDTMRMKEPSFRMVITGTDTYAYQRKDGIYIVPIGCLKN